MPLYIIFIGGTIFKKELLSNPAYYLLIISQCLNATGFLNLTTFLNIHINKQINFDDEYTAYLLIPMQLADLFGRIFVPYLSDW